MRKASDYLSTNRSRKSISPTDKSVADRRSETQRITEEMEARGIDTSRPTKRSECPITRPCPFVGCVYHLYLDVTNKGTIKFNFWGIEPWDMQDSCVLDIAEEYPNGLSLTDIGQYVGLTRERIRQIEKEALKQLKESEVDLQEWLRQIHEREANAATVSTSFNPSGYTGD